MKKLVRITAFLLALFSASFCVSCAPDKREETFFALDTYNTITVYGDQSAIEIARKVIEEGEARFSNTLNGSDISEINAHAGEAVKVSEETAALIRTACEISRLTHGAYDITVAPLVECYGFYDGAHRVPSEEERAAALLKVDYKNVRVSENTVRIGDDQSIDLGGIAKGYLADACAKALKDNGVSSAVISLGGNVRALGSKPDGSAFTVAVTDPVDQSAYLGYVRMKDSSLVTAGAYQRNFTLDGKFYHHIIDPHTGLCADGGLMSVSVLCSSGAKADALSTAFFVLGEEAALKIWREEKDFELILVRADGTVVLTEGIYSDFTSALGSSRAILCEKA